MPRTLVALALSAALGCAAPGAPLERGAWVRGRSNLYEIQATGLRWQQLPPGAGDWSNADLVLRESADSMLVVYLYARSAHSTDELVNIRRKSVEAELVVTSRSERREFLGGADLVPVAWVRYQVRDGALGEAFYSTAVIDTGERLIEIVAFNNGPRKGVLGNAQLDRVVRSIRLLPSARAGSEPA